MPVAKLDNAPRCRHTKADGSSCKAPALRNQDYCHFHLYLYTPTHPLMMPVIEDAHSLQIAVQVVLRALLQGALDHKTCSTVLYGLQIAASNLKRLAQEHATLEVEGDGDNHKSLVQLLLDRLDLEPEPTEDEVPTEPSPSPARSVSRGSRATERQHGDGPASLSPEIHACAATAARCKPLRRS